MGEDLSVDEVFDAFRVWFSPGEDALGQAYRLSAAIFTNVEASPNAPRGEPRYRECRLHVPVPSTTTSYSGAISSMIGVLRDSGVWLKGSRSMRGMAPNRRWMILGGGRSEVESSRRGSKWRAHGSKHRCALVGRFCGEKNLELLEAIISSVSSPQASVIHSDNVEKNLIAIGSLIPSRSGDQEPYPPRHGARLYY